jgi:hypothetical protein
MISQTWWSVGEFPLPEGWRWLEALEDSRSGFLAMLSDGRLIVICEDGVPNGEDVHPARGLELRERWRGRPNVGTGGHWGPDGWRALMTPPQRPANAELLGPLPGFLRALAPELRAIPLHLLTPNALPAAARARFHGAAAGTHPCLASAIGLSPGIAVVLDLDAAAQEAHYLGISLPVRLREILVHETAHALAACLFPYHLPAAEANRVRGEGHTMVWLRYCLHLVSRAGFVSEPLDAERVVRPEKYNLSPINQYIEALGTEPARARGVTFDYLLSCEPPAAFVRLWESDRRRATGAA